MIDGIRRGQWAAILIGTALLALALPAFGLVPTRNSCAMAIAIMTVAVVLLAWRRPPAELRAPLALAEPYLLFAVISLVTAAASYIAMRSGQPFVDPLLDRADAAIGLSWPAIRRAVVERPALHALLQCCYLACFITPPLVLALLWLTGRHERMYRLTAAHAVGGTLTVLIFSLAPAEAAFAYYAGALGTGAIPDNARDYGEAIAQLHRAGPVAIDLARLSGIVTFPSYHATLAILMAWAAWPLRWLRLPNLAVHVPMFLAAVPIGGHYGVDLIGGTAVAVVAIALATRGTPRLRTTSRAGLFRPTRGRRDVAGTGIAC